MNREVLASAARALAEEASARIALAALPGPHRAIHAAAALGWLSDMYGGTALGDGYVLAVSNTYHALRNLDGVPPTPDQAAVLRAPLDRIAAETCPPFADLLGAMGAYAACGLDPCPRRATAPVAAEEEPTPMYEGYLCRVFAWTDVEADFAPSDAGPGWVPEAALYLLAHAAEAGALFDWIRDNCAGRVHWVEPHVALFRDADDARGLAFALDAAETPDA